MKDMSTIIILSNTREQLQSNLAGKEIELRRTKSELRNLCPPDNTGDIDALKKTLEELISRDREDYAKFCIQKLNMSNMIEMLQVEVAELKTYTIKACSNIDATIAETKAMG